jgi:response regulator RpfG family c-di-GMP phosphodiesterase
MNPAELPPSMSSPDPILLVDDEPMILTLFREFVQEAGCECFEAKNLTEARQLVQRHPNLGGVFCDQLLPDGNGLDFLRELKTTRPNLVRVLITGFPDTKMALSAINQGEIFRFITKPCEQEQVTMAIHEVIDRAKLIRENQRLHAALVVGNEQLQKANKALQQALSDSVKMCVEILDRFDHILASHCTRVAKWSVAIGKALRLSPEELDTLEVAAQMHDIGLISVSPASHRKQQIGLEELSPSLQAAIHSHPKTGAELVKFLHQKGVPEIIAAHHEWFNGNGYPLALAQERIPFLASILAVPDAYDEVPMDRNDAARFIEENLGTRFHPEVGRAFLRQLENRPDYVQQEREVLIGELADGMKLSCNLFSASGVLLVPKGQTLNSKLIQYIDQHNQSDPLTQRIFVAL